MQFHKKKVMVLLRFYLSYPSVSFSHLMLIYEAILSSVSFHSSDIYTHLLCNVCVYALLNSRLEYTRFSLPFFADATQFNVAQSNNAKRKFNKFSSCSTSSAPINLVSLKYRTLLKCIFSISIRFQIEHLTWAAK